MGAGRAPDSEFILDGTLTDSSARGDATSAFEVTEGKADAAMRKLIDTALLRMGFDRTHITVLMTLAICLTFFFVFRSFFPLPQGLVWLAALTAVAALRYGLWVAYVLAGRKSTELGSHWQTLFVITSVLAGFSWSSGPLLFLHAAGSADAMLLVVMAVLAVSAVATSSLAAQPLAMQGFLLAALLPTGAALLLMGGEEAIIACTVIFAGAILLIIAGRESSKATRKLLETRLLLSRAMNTAHEALAESERAGQQVRELNEHLEQRVVERTEQLLAKDGELREAMSLNQEILMASVAGIAVYRPDGPCIMANPSFGDIVGGSLEDVLKENFRQLPYWPAAGMLPVAERVLDGGVKEALHVQVTTSFGRTLWLYCQFVRIINQGTPHLLLMIQDTTRYKTAEEEIKQLAFFDQLTNLPNRRLLLDRLQQAIISARRHKRYGALMVLDMDNFKALNDTLGHDVGDKFLREVAERLQSCVRAGDTVARQGGDEFMVILEDLHEDMLAASQAEGVAAKILHAISQPYQLELTPIAGKQQTYSYHCTSSIGIALFRDHAASVEELMKRADTAMYQAKAAGRNTQRFFDPDMQAEVAARAALENDLREAVRRNQFILHYQPQVDHGGRIIGAEVLVRWHHPERGMVSPADFISLAEMTGLILPIGHWVLETACNQLVAWAAQPELAHLTLAVNVSARQFLRADYVEQVEAVLSRSGTRPERLKLELTESLLLHNVEEIIEKMEALKARGISFSLDDFGTGYSSLSYLKRLPLDQFKIDQSFVRDVLTDPNDATIARTIVALGQSMGLVVIAEGVETHAQREFLAANGCYLYQGYYFGKPAPVEVFEQLVRDTK